MKLGTSNTVWNNPQLVWSDAFSFFNQYRPPDYINLQLLLSLTSYSAQHCFPNVILPGSLFPPVPRELGAVYITHTDLIVPFISHASTRIWVQTLGVP